MKQILYFLFFLPVFVAAQSTVVGDFSVGYRFDKIEQRGDANFPVEIPNGSTGILTLFDRTFPRIHNMILKGKFELFSDSDFYLQARASFGHIFGSLKNSYAHIINGNTHIAQLVLPSKKHSLDLLGTLGWQLRAFQSQFVFIPQAGAMVVRTQINENNRIAYAFATVGTTIQAKFTRHWQIDGHVYYLFSGRRSEQITLFNQQKINKVRRGIVHGFEFGGQLRYKVLAGFHLTTSYMYRRMNVQTKSRSTTPSGSFLDLETKWTSNQFDVGIGYIF